MCYKETTFDINHDRFVLDRESVGKVARALVESHQQYCVWKFMIIPESTVELTEIYSNETVNRFLQEAEEFLARIQSIEITGPMNSVCFHRLLSR